jgi:hypothetical protein
MEMLSVITFQLSFIIWFIKLYLLRWDTIGYVLDGRCSIPDNGKRFFLLNSVQTGSGAHPVGTGAISPWVKRPRHEIDHSPLFCWGQEWWRYATSLITRLHGMVLNCVSPRTAVHLYKQGPRTRQLSIYADDVNLLSKNLNTAKKKTWDLL